MVVSTVSVPWDVPLVIVVPVDVAGGVVRSVGALGVSALRVLDGPIGAAGVGLVPVGPEELWPAFSGGGAVIVKGCSSRLSDRGW